MTAQALFRIEVSGTAISIPEGDDIASLGVEFFCMSRGPANLHIGGLRSRNGVARHTEMVTRHVPVGDLVTVTYLEDHRPPAPLNPERLLEDVKKLEEEYERDFGRNVQPPPVSPRGAVLLTRTFEIRTSDGSQRVSAALDEDAQLQANVYWADGRCTFRVQSVFIHEDGSTHGEEFIALDLHPEQQIGLGLVT